MMNGMLSIGQKVRFPKHCKTLFIILALLGMLPGQAFASSCNSVLNMATIGAPFYEGDTVEILMEVGAGKITGGAENKISIDAVHFGPDCGGGQPIDSCSDQGNTIKYIPDSILSNCMDSNGRMIEFDVSGTTVLDFIPAQGYGPIVQPANSVCYITFDLKIVNFVSPPGHPFIVFEPGGWPNSEGTCDNLLKSAGTASVAFVVNEPAIDIEKFTNGEDADTPTGPHILVGDPVVWTYVVENTGNTTLTDIDVIDDKGVPVTCSPDTLIPGDSVTCTAPAGVAQLGQYTNNASVSGQPAHFLTGLPLGDPVTDEDPSHYFGDDPDFTIVKTSPQFPGPLVAPGLVSYSYVVSNTGNIALTTLDLIDSNTDPEPVCGKTTLEVGESTTCTASHVFTQDELNAGGNNACGLYNRVEATVAEINGFRWDELCIPVLQTPGFEIEKSSPQYPGPLTAPGTVNYSYLVSNTGNIVLTTLDLMDSNTDPEPLCGQTTLAVGESTTCTASHEFTQAELNAGGNDECGLYNRVEATVAEITGFRWDELCIPVEQTPMIDIEKATNGEDADTPTGPMVVVGSAVSWSYVVTNTGNVTLGVLVSDDQGISVSCPLTTLAPSIDMTCTASGTAEAGQYANVGTADGTPQMGLAVHDTDPSHYFGTNHGTDPCDLDLQLQCLVPAPPPTGVECTVKPREIVFEYTQGDCTASNNSQDGNASCTDFDTLVADVDVIYVGKNAATITMTSTDGIIWTLSAFDKLDPNSPLEIRSSSGELLQTVNLHTSCSMPLFIDDQFGSMKVLEMTNPDGTVIGGVPQLPADECTVYTSDTECTERPTALGFRFNGGDCSQTDNTQDSNKFDCTDFAPLGAGPFEIDFANTDGVVYETYGPFYPGDEFEVTAADAGRPDFDSETHFDIYEAGVLLQSVRFHSSCSQNLFAGDKYGNLEAISFTNSKQGTVTANNEVELWYTITNSSVSAINYIIAGDDNATPTDPGDDVLVSDGTVNDPVASGDLRVFWRMAQVTGDSIFTGFATAQDASNPLEVCGDVDDVTVLLREPSYSCNDGRAVALVFEYVGGDCSGSDNDQGRKAKCEDFLPLGSADVQVKYSGKGAKDYEITPEEQVIGMNDEVMISVKGKRKEFGVTTKLEIKRDGVKLQNIEIRTSCSVPLNVGDQFGSLILREYYPK
jgi:hypothetical protein